MTILLQWQHVKQAVIIIFFSSLIQTDGQIPLLGSSISFAVLEVSKLHSATCWKRNIAFFFYLLQLCCLAQVCILLWKEGDWDNHLGNTIDWGGQGLAYGAERKGGSAL